MRVLVTGSRTWRNHQPIHAALDEIHADNPGMVLVHGACRDGADAIADRWATLRGVQVERHPAQWHRFGRSAGPRRNEHMVGLGADVCLAFIALCRKPDCGEEGPHGSHGAEGCAALAKDAGIDVRPVRDPRIPRPSQADSATAHRGAQEARAGLAELGLLKEGPAE